MTGFASDEYKGPRDEYGYLQHTWDGTNLVYTKPNGDEVSVAGGPDS